MSKPNASPTPATAPGPTSSTTAPRPPPTPASTQATVAPAPPRPEQIRAKNFVGQITLRFPDVKVEWMRERRLKISTTASMVKEVGIFVRDNLGFDHISTVSGVDWIAQNQLEVVYFIGSTTPGQEDFILALSERIPREDPVAPSLVDVWRAVEYPERETHEMFGINFQGHPNQSHLFLPEDWNDLPPLRKDYISPGR